MASSGVLLVLGAARLHEAPFDLRFLFLAAVGLFSLAAIHLVDELLSILGSECPRCAEHFFGGNSERPAIPLRSRCSHCGATLPGTDPPAGRR